MNQFKQLGALMTLGAFLVCAGMDNALAESPIITQMAVTQQQTMDARAAVAAATDPATGAINLESEPMQCGIACGQQAKLEHQVCLGKVPNDERVRAGLPPPGLNCRADAHDKYSACLVRCGLEPLPAIPKFSLSQRRATPLALGSPEEMAKRRGAP